MLTPLGSLAGGAAGVVPAGKVVGPGLMHVTLADFNSLVPAYAASIHESQGCGIPSSSDSGRDAATTLCCSGTFSTPASAGANGSSFWLNRKRQSLSRCAASRAGGVGRSWLSGCVPGVHAIRRVLMRDSARRAGAALP